MQNLLANTKTFFKFLVFFAAINLVLLNLLSGVRAGAQGEFSPAACKTQRLTFVKILNPGNYLPLIPNGCGEDANGPVPISIALLPDILLRIYGFMVSIMFYSLSLVIVVAGIMYMSSGIAGEDLKGKALKYLQGAGVGIIITLLAGVAPVIVVNTLNIQLEATDLNFDSYFNINVPGNNSNNSNDSGNQGTNTSPVGTYKKLNASGVQTDTKSNIQLSTFFSQEVGELILDSRPQVGGDISKSVTEYSIGNFNSSSQPTLSPSTTDIKVFWIDKTTNLLMVDTVRVESNRSNGYQITGVVGASESVAKVYGIEMIELTSSDGTKYIWNKQ